MASNEMSRSGADAGNVSRSFFRFTTTRPVAILMVVIGITVFGWISYQQLSMNLMPDISYPSLTVRTEYPGTAPEEVETAISRPIEQALGVVDNLVSISSISQAGRSDVKLEFTWDTDMNKATADVREMLDQVFLPDDAQRPLILRYDPTLDPILRLGLSGDASLVYLRYLAEEEIKRELETVDGVAAVKVKGGLEEEIRVELDEQKLALIGIDIQQVRNRLAQENVNLAGGTLKEGQTEYLVRTLNEFRSVEDIAELVIGNWNGREIKVKDVAEVRRSSKDRELITRINGRESVEIEIYKEADANVVAVAERVKRKVFGTTEQREYVRKLHEKQGEAGTKLTAANGGANQELLHRRMTDFIAYDLPAGIQIDVLSDQSIFIKNAVNEVKNTALLGALLAVVVLLIFLRNLRSTLIVGISIPVSIVATFAAMRLFDVSLNIMSLGGLALGVGMLVDNSIVVLESIARCREEGDGLIAATLRGVSEVGSAVFASTLTTVAVFFPIVFVEGVAGQIFGDLALTVVFSLLASLAVALFLIPMLSSRETRGFVISAGVTNLPQDHLLQFPDPTPGEGRFPLRTALRTAALLFGKLALCVLHFAVAAIKLIGAPLVLAATPVAALTHRLGWLQTGAGELAARYAEFDPLRSRGVGTVLWPNYQRASSLVAAVESFHRFGRRFAAAGVAAKAIWLLLFPLPFVFYLIKFILSWLLEWGFRVWHLFAMVIALVIKGGSRLATYIVGPIFAAAVSLFHAGYGYLERGYPVMLEKVLRHRGRLLAGVAAVFAFTVGVLGPRLGSELIPEVHQGEFNLEVILPVGTPVEETDGKVKPIEQEMAARPEVAMVASVAGVDKTASTDTEAGEHTAKLTIRLNRDRNIIESEEEVIRYLRRRMRDFSGMEWKISRPVLFSFKTPIEVQIQGYDLSELHAAAKRVEEAMQDIPGVFDVKSNMQRGNPEVQILYNRSLLARYGLNLRNVAEIVRNKIRGDVATEFKDRDRKIDILVRLRESDRQSIDDLRRLVVNPGSAVPIPLEAVAEIRVSEGPSEIRRVDQQRTAVITANISGRDLSSVSEDILRRLRQMEFPPDFTFTLAGQNREMQTSLDSLRLALALAIFLVYIVMASQFESLVHPFIIIFTIPLALIGVVWALFILEIPLSIVVFLGMIMLAGIVVNNAIVLVDYINQLRERGMDKIEAIVQAGSVRLRPILMTTTTTVLGLLPMAIGLGEGAEIRTPMAITVIVGLISSTVLTLVVIPAVYAVMGGGRRLKAVETDVADAARRD